MGRLTGKMAANPTFPEGKVRRNWLKAVRYPQFAAEVSKTEQIRPLARDGRTLAQVEEDVLASEVAPPLTSEEVPFLDNVFARPQSRLSTEREPVLVQGRQPLDQVAQGLRLTYIAWKNHIGQVCKTLHPIQSPDGHACRDLAQDGGTLAAQAILGQFM